MATRSRRKKNTVSRTSIGDLPSPITRDILSRLPVNSVARSRCVCKTWRDLASDPFFAKLHLLRSSKSVSLFYPCPYELLSGRNDMLIVDEQIKGGRLYHRNSTLGRFKTNNFPLKCLNLVCSCNGMLLFVCRMENTIYICNPIKGSESVLLPDPVIKVPATESMRVNYGFGYCPRSDQYKVIRMVTSGFFVRDRVLRCEMLILGNKEWRYIGAAPFSQRTPYPSYNEKASPWTPLNGSMHLLVMGKEGPLGGQPFILCFKLYEETLSVLAPGPVSVGSFWTFTLGVIQNRLAILHTDESISGIDVWVMNDYGVNGPWTKKWCIADSIITKTLKSALWLKPIKYTEDEGLLMSYSSQDWKHASAMVSFDPERNKLRKHKLHMFLFHEQIDYAPTFLSPRDLVQERNNNRVDLSEPSESVLEPNSNEHI